MTLPSNGHQTFTQKFIILRLKCALVNAKISLHLFSVSPLRSVTHNTINTLQVKNNTYSNNNDRMYKSRTAMDVISSEC